jgi:hypothetical protein
VLHYTRLEGLARDKQYSLFGQFIKKMKCCEYDSRLVRF